MLYNVPYNKRSLIMSTRAYINVHDPPDHQHYTNLSDNIGLRYVCIT